MGVFRDILGNRYGRLVVLSVAGKGRFGGYEWLCKCDCGQEKVIPSDHLTRKTQPVQSCGCLRDDRTRQACSTDPDGVAFRLLVGAYKKRAAKKDIEYSLSDELFREITSSPCAYCGAEPQMLMENRGKTGAYVYNSIDRKDPTIGYTKQNSAPCCKSCNYMKWTFTEAEFISRISAIAAKRCFSEQA